MLPCCFPPFDSKDDYYKRSRESNTPGICGLQNMGNTCYMNSALQCLANIELIHSFMPTFKAFLDQCSRETGANYLFHSFLTLIKDMWSGQFLSIEPSNFRLRVRQLFPQFNNLRQKDCSEFLTTILNRFHEELMEMQGLNTNDFTDYTNFEDYIKNNDSFISRHFQGFQRFQLSCKHCGQTLTENYSPFYVINLPQIESQTLSQTTVLLVREDSTTTELELSFTDNMITVKEMLEKLLETFEERRGHILNVNNMIVTTVLNGNIEKIMSDQDNLDLTKLCGSLLIYEIDPLLKRHIFIILRDKNGQNFGYPILLNLNDSSYSNISLLFSQKFSKYLTDQGDCLELLNNVEFSVHQDNNYFVFCSKTNISLDNKQVIIAKDLPTIFRVNYENLKIILTGHRANSKTNCPRLKDTLKRYLSTKVLGSNDQLFCSQCVVKRNANEKIEIINAPDVLMFQMKTNPYQQGIFDNYQCTYPMTLDFGPFLTTENQMAFEFTYDLIAVSNIIRMGSLGHYTAFAQNYRNKKWYEFSDSSVTEIKDQNKLISPNAYIVFYLRNALKNKPGIDF